MRTTSTSGQTAYAVPSSPTKHVVQLPAVAIVRFVAGELAFEWDADKAAANRRKHRVSFEEAATVFLDPDAQVFDDPDSDELETRYLLVGLSAATRTLVVVHVERTKRIRLISARVATRRERRAFEEGE